MHTRYYQAKRNVAIIVVDMVTIVNWSVNGGSCSHGW